MKGLCLKLLICAIPLCLATGCASLFPRTETTVISRWNSYGEVLTAFNQIVPGQTSTNELITLGFDPSTSANIQVLNYIDIINHFMPNPSITKADLPEAVRKCIENQTGSLAYQIDLNNVKTKRLGNLFLDMTNFKRITHTTGWKFSAFLLIQGDQVVYKISSGEPTVDSLDKRIRPLGPFQEIEGVVVSGAQAIK